MPVSSTYSLFVYIWSFGVDLNKIEFICMSLKTYIRGCLGRDLMVVALTTTCAISAHQHRYCELESRPGRGVQRYVIKFVSDLRQVGGVLRVLRFPPQIKLSTTIANNL